VKHVTAQYRCPPRSLLVRMPPPADRTAAGTAAAATTSCCCCSCCPCCPMQSLSTRPSSPTLAARCVGRSGVGGCGAAGVRSSCWCWGVHAAMAAGRTRKAAGRQGSTVYAAAAPRCSGVRAGMTHPTCAPCDLVAGCTACVRACLCVYSARMPTARAPRPGNPAAASPTTQASLPAW
jgi:hypothetical protein